jgi:hypothetical protein
MNILKIPTYVIFYINFLVTYILFRGLLCPFILWYPCLVSSTTPLIVKAMCSSLVLQSYYFIFQMVSIIKKKIIKYKEIKSKKVNLEWFT